MPWLSDQRQTPALIDTPIETLRLTFKYGAGVVLLASAAAVAFSSSRFVLETERPQWPRIDALRHPDAAVA